MTEFQTIAERTYRYRDERNYHAFKTTKIILTAETLDELYGKMAELAIETDLKNAYYDDWDDESYEVEFGTIVEIKDTHLFNQDRLDREPTWAAHVEKKRREAEAKARAEARAEAKEREQTRARELETLAHLKTKYEKEANMTSLTFLNRETYLSWRTEWRAQYKNISQAIRQKKQEIKENYRSGNTDKASRGQSQLHYLRGMANNLMESRREANKLRDAYIAQKKTAQNLEAAS